MNYIIAIHKLCITGTILITYKRSQSLSYAASMCLFHQSYLFLTCSSKIERHVNDKAPILLHIPFVFVSEICPLSNLCPLPSCTTVECFHFLSFCFGASPSSFAFLGVFLCPKLEMYNIQSRGWLYEAWIAYPADKS